MYVDRIKHKNPSGKVYVHYFLRTSRREGKRTIKTTVLNITPWGEQTCEAIAVALKHQHNLKDIIAQFEVAQAHSDTSTPRVEQGKSIGSVWLLAQLSQRLGIADALGDTQEGRLALWQVMARTLDQGSRLSAVRLARTHEIDFLRLGRLDEDVLYENLDWIAENQTRIENTLFHKHHPNGSCTLFLYDVTSSYFEGVHNELAAFGYNRDKKKGKMQIVVGLLCDNDGRPVAVEVFEGNTNDTKTMHNQIRKVADRFNAENVVFVGDRGMIKSSQQKELKEENFDFITALTKPQIETLIKQSSIQMSFFDEKIHEVVLENGSRYILRCNPVRAAEIAENRKLKQVKLDAIVAERNRYLKEHPKAKTATAVKYCEDRVKRLKIDGWISVSCEEASRIITLHIDESKLKEISLLDGCYCLTTSLSAEKMSKEDVHSRYKDLAMVEEAFRTCKTGQLELRPIYVRKAGRTRAHVFVVMLSYLLVRELQDSWRPIDMTVEEGLDLLTTLCTARVNLGDGREYHQIPAMRQDLGMLYAAVNLEKPRILPGGKTVADSQRKLQSRRKSNK